MPDSEEVNVEEVHVDDDILPTDEELSQAFDNFMGTTERTEEPVSVEPIVEEERVEPIITESKDDLHSESSRLGRKIARLEGIIEDLSSKVVTQDQIDNLIKKSDFTTIEEEEIQDITNVNELKKFMDVYISKREEEKTKAYAQEKKSYESSYLNTMKDLISEVDDENASKEIYKMMLYDEKLNVRLSNNPFVDAAKNFSRAQKAYLSLDKSRFDKVRVATPPSGITPSTSKNEVHKVKLPVLDSDAEELRKSLGMSDEEVAEALNGDMSPSLQRHGK
jgi:hypothetical protein